MHYKNGTSAEAGDLVLNTETYSSTAGVQRVGIITGGQSNSTTCNGNIQVLSTRRLSELGWGPWTPVSSQSNDWSVTLSQCEKIESAPVAEAAHEPAPAVETKEAVSAA
jgi:hypothetical protein